MPSNDTPSEADDKADAPECATRDEDSGEETEPSTSGTVIDPQDGLFQGMAELQNKLGSEKFMERLLEASSVPYDNGDEEE